VSVETAQISAIEKGEVKEKGVQVRKRNSDKELDIISSLEAGQAINYGCIPSRSKGIFPSSKHPEARA
jgi:hypothetical protein